LRVAQLPRDLDRSTAVFEIERESLLRPFAVRQSEQRPGVYLQMIATFAVADEFVSERAEFPGLLLLIVVADETQSGHLGVWMISNALGDVVGLRIEFISRASIATRMFPRS